MELYLLRHAIAGERTTTSEAKDSERRLTKEGRKKMLRAAKGMRKERFIFDLILTSPYARALETAQIVAGVFGIEKRMRLTAALTPVGNPQELIEEIHRRHRGRKRVLLVGHEPYLSRLVAVLLTGDTGMTIDFKKGGLCKLAVSQLGFGRCATLEWLLTPKQLRKLG
jgi:phosphohistidine phosphatase